MNEMFPLVEVRKINITRWQMFQLGLWSGIGFFAAGILTATVTFVTQAVVFLVRANF